MPFTFKIKIIVACHIITSKIIFVLRKQLMQVEELSIIWVQQFIVGQLFKKSSAHMDSNGSSPPSQSLDTIPSQFNPVNIFIKVRIFRTVPLRSFSVLFSYLS
jgi:hypothetical protein